MFFFKYDVKIFNILGENYNKLDEYNFFKINLEKFALVKNLIGAPWILSAIYGLTYPFH